ncbi:copia protein [Gossypium australe]|uniref:Copia protein n=1 Tax=Gossypium australe TaxID=47621 RepID=A0A5B6VYR1_9ROSI|nr:copia protein [Gossypium australe]
MVSKQQMQPPYNWRSRIFRCITEKYSTHMKLSDRKHVKIKGQGVVGVSTDGGNKKHIRNVYYSSKISQNLSSVEQMMKNGYKLNFYNDRCDIIDKNSNMKVYFLDNKSDAFNTFLHFKAFVEKQSGCSIKTLRTNRGGEFIYKPFLKYCKENRIKWQLTMRYTLQQNEVSERKNQTIKEMAHSMLKGKGLPNKF